MQEIKSLWIGLLVVLVIAIGGYFYPKVQNLFGSTNVQTIGKTGPTSGTWTAFDNIYTGDLNAIGTTTVLRFKESGHATATSTSNGNYGGTGTAALGADTLLANQLIADSQIAYTPNVASTTITLPASSTLATLVPNAGDIAKIAIYNATTTSGVNLIIAGNTGIFLGTASTTFSINSTHSAIITFIRQPDTDISALLLPF